MKMTRLWKSFFWHSHKQTNKQTYSVYGAAIQRVHQWIIMISGQITFSITTCFSAHPELHLLKRECVLHGNQPSPSVWLHIPPTLQASRKKLLCRLFIQRGLGLCEEWCDGENSCSYSVWSGSCNRLTKCRSNVQYSTLKVWHVLRCVPWLNLHSQIPDLLMQITHLCP